MSHAVVTEFSRFSKGAYFTHFKTFCEHAGDDRIVSTLQFCRNVNVVATVLEKFREKLSSADEQQKFSILAIFIHGESAVKKFLIFFRTFAPLNIEHSELKSGEMC